MNSKAITQIIEKELKADPALRNDTGLDLNRCLIEPTLQSYHDSGDEDEMMELWTVLEESEDGYGYKIVYDPEAVMFGLGIRRNEDGLVFLGYYGTFAETLRGL